MQLLEEWCRDKDEPPSRKAAKDDAESKFANLVKQVRDWRNKNTLPAGYEERINAVTSWVFDSKSH